MKLRLQNNDFNKYAKDYSRFKFIESLNVNKNILIYMTNFKILIWKIKLIFC